MTVVLEPLTFAADPAQWSAGGTGKHAEPASADVPCAYCGVRSGEWRRAAGPGVAHGDGTAASTQSPSDVPTSACPLCALSYNLDRPSIDEEAALAWLPEVSQPAVTTMLREVHVELYRLREGLHAGDRFRLDTPERRTLHHARAALEARVEPAVERFGTGRPSELGAALLRLSPAAYAQRATLLSGLRLLPLGRLYEAGVDVYPKVVATWSTPPLPSRRPTVGADASPASRPAPVRLFRRR